MSNKKIYALAVLLFASLLLMPAAFAQPKKANLQNFEYTPSSQGSSGPVDKRAAVNGNKQLRVDPTSDEAKEKKTGNPNKPFYVIGLILFILAGCSPFAVRLFRENNERLAAQNAFGRNPDGVGEPVHAPKKKPSAGEGRIGSDPRKRRASSADSSALARTDENYGAEEKPSVPLVSPEELHEKVWYTLADSGKWMTAESVARVAKLDLEQVREELTALAEEQHIESTKDRVGRPMYKFIA